MHKTLYNISREGQVPLPCLWAGSHAYSDQQVYHISDVDGD